MSHTAMLEIGRLRAYPTDLDVIPAIGDMGKCGAAGRVLIRRPAPLLADRCRRWRTAVWLTRSRGIDARRSISSHAEGAWGCPTSKRGSRNRMLRRTSSSRRGAVLRACGGWSS